MTARLRERNFWGIQAIALGAIVALSVSLTIVGILLMALGLPAWLVVAGITLVAALTAPAWMAMLIMHNLWAQAHDIKAFWTVAWTAFTICLLTPMVVTSLPALFAVKHQLRKSLILSRAFHTYASIFDSTERQAHV